MGNPYEVIISLPAQKDVLEIIQYYETVRLGLGDEFLLSFDETLNFLSTHPNIYAKVYNEFHQAFMNTFQYAIFFKISEIEKEVEVVGIFHTSRDTEIWKKRIKLFE